MFLSRGETKKIIFYKNNQLKKSSDFGTPFPLNLMTDLPLTRRISLQRRTLNLSPWTDSVRKEGCSCRVCIDTLRFGSHLKKVGYHKVKQSTERPETPYGIAPSLILNVAKKREVGMLPILYNCGSYLCFMGNIRCHLR